MPAQITDQKGSGPFGRGGGNTVRARLRFGGALGPDFADFVAARAKRLSVSAQISGTLSEMVVDVEGVEPMIGALEMAACIGPETCRIDWWTCETR